LSPNFDPITASADDPLVTVIICTHNRCAVLAETLNAVMAQEGVDFAFVILVVDNASKDRTPQLVEAIAQRAAVEIRYILDPIVGLSHARNVALDYAQTPYVAFLDDDCQPSPQWLAALIEPFRGIVPPPGAVGGRIWLRWTNAPPRWMSDELRGYFGYLDYGEDVQSVRMVNGGNIAFPTAVVRRYAYDTRLGLVGRQQTLGEDVDILLRMRKDHLAIYYQPGALVWHILGEQRENRSFLLRRSRGLGRQQAQLATLYHYPGRLGVLRLMLKEAWSRRHWWKRIALDLVRGTLLRSVPERMWVRSTLVRFFAFQRVLLTLVVKGEKTLGR